MLVPLYVIAFRFLHRSIGVGVSLGIGGCRSVVYSGEKSVVADFQLKKVKEEDPLESLVDRGILQVVGRGK